MQNQSDIYFYYFYYIVIRAHTRIFIIFLRAVVMVSCSIRTENECSCERLSRRWGVCGRVYIYVFRTLSPSLVVPTSPRVHVHPTYKCIYIRVCVRVGIVVH